MKAREEAKELIQLFYNNQCSHSITELAYKSAKQCALICVDDKINFIKELQISDLMKYDLVEYQEEIKQEINKLQKL